MASQRGSGGSAPARWAFRRRRPPLPAPAGAELPSSFYLAPTKPDDPKTAAAKLNAPTQPVPVGTADAREVQP